MTRRCTRAFLAVGLMGVAACGTSSDSQLQAVASDPGALFDRLASVREQSDSLLVVEPTTMTEVLTGAVGGREPGSERVFSWFDAVVMGEITDIRPGDGVDYSEEPEADGWESRVVDFDDPSADAHNVILTIVPAWVKGAEAGDEIQVRMGVIGGGDPQVFIASLSALQKSPVVAVLKSRTSGPNAGEFYPIMRGGLLGVVGPDGALSFPGLGEIEKEFLGDIDTADELKAATEADVKIG